MSFVIQTRPEGLNLKGDLFLKSQISWINKGPEFDTEEEALKAVENMIKSGELKAENIRMLKLVATFSSKTIVNTHKS